MNIQDSFFYPCSDILSDIVKLCLKQLFCMFSFHSDRGFKPKLARLGENRETRPVSDCGSDHSSLVIDIKTRLRKNTKENLPRLRVDLSGPNVEHFVKVKNHFENSLECNDELILNELWEKTRKVFLV